MADAYLHLTKEVLPALAQSGGKQAHVRLDHCFQRIILDTICGGAWYAYLDRPAYKNLTHDQAQWAVDLFHEIAEGRADLRKLNNQSLIWRSKRPKVLTAFEEQSRCLSERR